MYSPQYPQVFLYIRPTIYYPAGPWGGGEYHKVCGFIGILLTVHHRSIIVKQTIHFAQ